jgi:hypothetical protein
LAYETNGVLGVILAPNVVASDGDDYLVPGVWADFADRPVRLTGASSDVYRANASFSGGAEGGVKLAFTAAGGNGTPVDGTIDFTAKWIDGLDEGHLDVRLYNTAADIGSQYYRVWVPGGLETASVALPELLLPWLGVPTYDATTRAIAWPHTGEAAWDSTYVELLWETASTTGTWTIIAPPGAHEVVLPEIPAAFAAWLPDDILTTDVDVRLFEASDLDWDGARATGFTRQGRVPRPYEIAGTPTVRQALSGEVGDG